MWYLISCVSCFFFSFQYRGEVRIVDQSANDKKKRDKSLGEEGELGFGARVFYRDEEGVYIGPYFVLHKTYVGGKKDPRTGNLEGGTWFCLLQGRTNRKVLPLSDLVL